MQRDTSHHNIRQHSARKTHTHSLSHRAPSSCAECLNELNRLANQPDASSSLLLPLDSVVTVAFLLSVSPSPFLPFSSGYVPFLLTLETGGALETRLAEVQFLLVLVGLAAASPTTASGRRLRRELAAILSGAPLGRSVGGHDNGQVLVNGVAAQPAKWLSVSEATIELSLRWLVVGLVFGHSVAASPAGFLPWELLLCRSYWAALAADATRPTQTMEI